MPTRSPLASRVHAARQSGAGNGSLYLDAAIEALDKLRDGLMVLAGRKP